MGNKKICLISPSLQMGGLERAMSNLANYFSSKGYKVYYVVLFRFDKFYDLNDKITFIEPEFDKKETFKLFYYFRIISYLRKTVKQIKPDTVLSFGDYHNALVLFSLKWIKIPIYVSDRSSPNKDFGKVFSLFKKWTYAKSSGIIAQTKRAESQKYRMLGYGINVSVIPNAIREVKSYNLIREKIILGVGRHYQVKGLDRLIRAFSKIENTDWVLQIAGSNGPESKKLLDLVIELGVEKRVHFLGKILNMDEVFSKAGVFVLSSHSEGFPNALCEAMSSGLPCISYDIIAGPAEIIKNNKNGILVENGNEKELVKAISLLITDDKERLKLGSNAQYVKTDFSLQNSGDRYLEFIFSHENN